MTKLLQATFIVLLSFSIFADDHVMSSPTFVPLEIQQCNFENNKDMDDFLKHIPAWNELLDEYSQFPYSGWVLVPHYRTASNFDFDFGTLILHGSVVAALVAGTAGEDPGPESERACFSENEFNSIINQFLKIDRKYGL